MIEKQFDVIIIGGGASGLMCALQSAKRGLKVCVVDHADKLGSKIRISGGGRCNFTNLHIDPEKYISKNKHFCKSALAQFSQYDFIEMLKEHKIKYHEKTLGQLFCDESAKQIVDMFVSECKKHEVKFYFNKILQVVQNNRIFVVSLEHGKLQSKNLVIATGGLSIPKMGATNFGLKIAEQFGLEIVKTEPALVPLTYSENDKNTFESLSGISFDAEVTCGKMLFKEKVLFTHRGLSGPAILQISSYWKQGQELKINILPELDWAEFLEKKREQNSRQELKTALSEVLQKRFVALLFDKGFLKNISTGLLSDKYIQEIETFFTEFKIKPNGTEGYRKAEVTKGGVSTKELDSKTMESKKVKGLYFIGEVIDVTGHLGGYNFQWAWSSGYVAGQEINT